MCFEILAGMAIFFVVFIYFKIKRKTIQWSITLALCAANAFGWLIVLLTPDEGGGMCNLSLKAGAFFLFINCNYFLIPAACLMLLASWNARERKSFILSASIYLLLNILVLFGPLLLYTFQER